MNKQLVRTKNQGSIPIILNWLLAFLLVASAVVGVFLWQQHRVDDLNAKVSSLNQEVAKLHNQKQPTAPTTTVSDKSNYTSQHGVTAVVYTPKSGATVSSPLAVVGEVPGNWSFEASFPVLLKNSEGTVVAQGPATVLGNWTTDKLVPFSVKLTYSSTPTGTGTLVLQKDNPSGLPQNEDTITVPVHF